MQINTSLMHLFFKFTWKVFINSLYFFINLSCFFILAYRNLLKCKGPEIIGNLFDKVQFLEERITELTCAMELRKKINAEIIKDIEVDIRDKETFATQCTDFDDLRSIKLHISMLKQQKRKELIQHFHDTIELSTELQALKEEHQIEKKITSLFEDIRAA